MPYAFPTPTTVKLAHINMRLEKHGDESVTALDLKFIRTVNTAITADQYAAVRERLKRDAAQPQAAGWRPISEAPRDGTRILVTNGFGVWFAEWRPVAPSGFRFADPWFSTMLNHNHISEKHRHKAPTHWQPLPEPPPEGE